MEFHLWTDGSFNQTLGFSKWAYKLLDRDDNVLKADAGTITDPEYNKSWQIAGEAFAVLEGLRSLVVFLEKNNIRFSDSEIYIHYDYEGIKKFATGEYNPKKKLTREYKNTIQWYISHEKLKLNWEKVKAHSGVELNEEVDQMASNAPLNNCKFFEVRDRHTYIPIIAVKMVSENKKEQKLISSKAYRAHHVVVTRLSDLKSEYDKNRWSDPRTMKNAHKYIEENFDNLQGGEVIDIEYILEKKEEPVISQNL